MRLACGINQYRRDKLSFETSIRNFKIHKTHVGTPLDRKQIQRNILSLYLTSPPSTWTVQEESITLARFEENFKEKLIPVVDDIIGPKTEVLSPKHWISLIVVSLIPGYFNCVLHLIQHSVKGTLSQNWICFAVFVYPMREIVLSVQASIPIFFMHKLFECQGRPSWLSSQACHHYISTLATCLLSVFIQVVSSYFYYYCYVSQQWIPGMLLYSVIYGSLIFLFTPRKERITRMLYECKMLDSVDDEVAEEQSLLNI